MFPGSIRDGKAAWTRAQSGSFLTGDAITAADLIWAPMVAYHAKQVGTDRAYRSRPSLADWMGRMAERPSFKETA